MKNKTPPTPMYMMFILPLDAAWVFTKSLLAASFTASTGFGVGGRGFTAVGLKLATICSGFWIWSQHQSDLFFELNQF
eukprot:UN03280